MNVSLNSEQAKGLANFFFDVAKGLVLGGVGFAAITQTEAKLVFVLISTFIAYWCVRLALSILEEPR